jgi:hypothetical protein
MLVTLVVVALAFVVYRFLSNGEVFNAFIVALMQIVLITWHHFTTKTP